MRISGMCGSAGLILRRARRLVTTLAMTLGSALMPAAAQAQDLKEIYKQFEQYRSAGRYPEAERLGRQAIELCEARFGRDRPNCAWILNNLESVYEKQGKYAEAEKLLQRVLAIQEKVFGPDHENVVKVLEKLAGLYPQSFSFPCIFCNDYFNSGPTTEPYLKRIIAIREKALGPADDKVVEALAKLASVYAKQSRYTEAEKLLLRPLAIREQTLGRDHDKVVEILEKLANLFPLSAR